jgi:hypothetical protein
MSIVWIQFVSSGASRGWHAPTLPVIVLLALSTAGFSANSRYRFAPCAHRVPVIANLEPAARVGWLTPILRLDQVGQSGPPCSLGHQLASRVHRNLPGPLRGRKDEVQRADHLTGPVAQRKPRPAAQLTRPSARRHDPAAPSAASRL